MKVSEQFEQDIENALINVFTAKRDGLQMGIDLQSYYVVHLLETAKELARAIRLAELAKEL